MNVEDKKNGIIKRNRSILVSSLYAYKNKYKSVVTCLESSIISYLVFYKIKDTFNYRNFKFTISLNSSQSFFYNNVCSQF